MRRSENVIRAMSAGRRRPLFSPAGGASALSKLACDARSRRTADLVVGSSVGTNGLAPLGSWLCRTRGASLSQPTPCPLQQAMRTPKQSALVSLYEHDH